jgi:hypothetical protein
MSTHVRFERVILFSFCLLAGCAQSRQATEETGPRVYRAPLPSLRSAPVWSPSYISTGLSTGIMIASATPNGTRMSMDLWRYPIETTAVVVIEPVADPTDPRKSVERPVPYLEIRSDLVILNTTINDLGQAFFKVPPGTYLLHPRLSKEQNIYVAGVEVREGSYAIVAVHPEAPRASMPD